MTALDFMALFSIAMMVVIGILIFVVLGSLPGQIAKKRGHPNATAIQIGGWATLVFAMVGWPFVLMWAFMGEANPRDDRAGSENADDSASRSVRDLAHRLTALESKLNKAEG